MRSAIDIRFLGTRGHIDMKSRLHRWHASALFSCGQGRLMIDCGEDWLGRVSGISPDAILVTHGHPDHAFGLKRGAPCPVYATKETWQNLAGFPIKERRLVVSGVAFRVVGLAVRAFSLVHSTRAPAVGYRISRGKVSVSYVPDVVYIEERRQALRGCRVYIGDGATVIRSMVRKPGKELIGHVPIRAQLTWCAKEGVPEAVFTHCGTQIVGGDERKLGALIRSLARERRLHDARIAHDGMEVEVSNRTRAVVWARARPQPATAARRRTRAGPSAPPTRNRLSPRPCP
jgi:ribonuclease BN (tRNA processing enzyme)